MSSLQPLDRMEREEVRKEAEKFVEPGFKLVAKEKVGRGRVARVLVPGVEVGCEGGPLWSLGPCMDGWDTGWLVGLGQDFWREGRGCWSWDSGAPRDSKEGLGGQQVWRGCHGRGRGGQQARSMRQHRVGATFRAPKLGDQLPGGHGRSQTVSMR